MLFPPAPLKKRKKRAFPRDPSTLSAAERTLDSLQTSQQTWEDPNLQLGDKRGTTGVKTHPVHADEKATTTPGRLGTTEELQHSPPVYLGAWNPSSQLLCLACLTTHTEPVLLGLCGETSHTGQRQISKNSSRVGIICFYYFGTEVLQQSFWHRKKFSSESDVLKGSAQLTEHLT